MRHLRQLLIALLMGFTLLFNIERVDLGGENINIDTFVYVLGIVAAVAIISLPILWRSPIAVSLALWLGLYLFGKLFVFNQRPLLGDIYTYISITEVTLLAISIWLTHTLARAVHDFEQAVENITLPNGNRRVRPLNDAAEDIQVEMFRSRHNHHPLSVVVVEPQAESVQAMLHQAVREVQETMMHSYIINSMAQTLSKYLRRTDLILEQRDKGRFIILCPETNAKDLELLVEYIQTIIAKQLGATLACGIATFPDEALTFEELIHQAEADLHQPASSTYPVVVEPAAPQKPAETEPSPLSAGANDGVEPALLQKPLELASLSLPASAGEAVQPLVQGNGREPYQPKLNGNGWHPE